MIDLNEIYIYDWSDLHWMEYEIKINYESLRLATNDHEKIISDRKREFKLSTEKDDMLNSEWESDEIKAQYYSQFYEHQEIAIKELKRVFNNSVLLMSFSIFESKLKQLCEMIQKRIGSERGHDDLKSNEGDIGKFKKYLTTVFGLSLDSIKRELDTLGINKTIRNRIVHNDGYVDENDAKKFAKIKGVKIQDFGTSFQIYIEDTEYLEGIVRDMEKIFDKLLLSVDGRIRNNYKI